MSKFFAGFTLVIMVTLAGMNMAYADDGKKPDEEVPVKELPLYPKERAISIALKEFGRPHEAVLIDVIVDDSEHRMHVWGEKAEHLVSFRLRTDGLPHTSAQFFGKPTGHPDIFSSAVVLVPDEESLKLWQEWMTNELARLRVQPARVLPPK